MGPELRHLTVGDDGSAAADAAWAWVTAQWWPGWSVDLVHAGSSDGIGADERRARVAPRRCGFARVRELVSPLDPATALRCHAGTDLLVIGGHHGRAPSGGGLGGVAERLVDRVEVPTVIAREGRAARRVLAFVGDETPSPWSGLDVLKGLPWAESAVVTVLALDDPARAHLDQARQAVEDLTGAGARAHLQSASPDPTVAMTRPVHRVMEVIDRAHPDLVVLAAPRPSRVARRILGSVAAEVTRAVPCSVLLTTR